MEKEWQTVALAEKAKIFSTVNLYLRNSWYHNTIKDFIAQAKSANWRSSAYAT